MLGLPDLLGGSGLLHTHTPLHQCERKGSTANTVNLHNLCYSPKKLSIFNLYRPGLLRPSSVILAA